MTLTLNYHPVTKPKSTDGSFFLSALLGVGGAITIIAFITALVCMLVNVTAGHAPKLVPAARIVTAATQQTAPTVTHPQQQPAPAQPAAAPAAPAAPAPSPYYMYDSVNPSAIPAGQPAAVYADGYYATPVMTGHSSVTWIDTNGTDPAANVLDVEPGDATPQGAGQWANTRVSMYPDSTAVIYTMRSEWPDVQAAVSALPSSVQSHVQYWIADPTGVPHIVPGSSATQWSWGQGYDTSEANPNFNQQGGYSHDHSASR